MITRRVHRSVPHVWTRDPAIDRSDEEKVRTGFKSFLEDGELSHLPIRQGCRPTVFRVASLKRAHLQEVGRMAQIELSSLLARSGVTEGIAGLAMYELNDLVVSRGVISVENLQDESGRPVSLQFTDDGRGGKVLARETLEELSYVPLINELGLRILQLSMPDPTSGQG